MIIEIVGVGFSNKGAELMLAATVDRLTQTVPGICFAVDPSVGSYERRAHYGLLQRFDARSAGRLGWLRQKLFHGGYQRRFGLVTEKNIMAILDASGFVLGDAWPENSAHSRARAFTHWRSQGKHIVLLPQAMGPFQRQSTRKAYRQILDATDLVFARDETSYAHAKDLAPNHPGLKIARDFTNLLLGPQAPVLDSNRQWAAIVPNAMMLRQKSQECRINYISFLVRCADHLRKQDIKPCIVLYETKMDWDLGEEIRQSITGSIEVLVEEDPIRLKSITGEFWLTIGSRFHGLVNALSQGVPSIGTSWSHKYQALFEDYGRPEWLLDSPGASDRATDLITQILENHESQRNHLLSYANRYKEETEAMWQQIEDLFIQ